MTFIISDMVTKQDLEQSLKDALRARDEVRKRTLRMLLSAIKLAEVEKRVPLDEAGFRSVLQRELKVRQETIADAERAGRLDIASESRAELDFLKQLLPPSISRAELEALAKQAIQQTDAKRTADVGKVMKVLLPLLQGRADGREASDAVRKLLSE
ncbi:MAG: GatB/YqeY domain-containing protein [Anaerolineales bacterium]